MMQSDADFVTNSLVIPWRLLVTNKFLPETFWTNSCLSLAMHITGKLLDSPRQTMRIDRPLFQKVSLDRKCSEKCSPRNRRTLNEEICAVELVGQSLCFDPSEICRLMRHLRCQWPSSSLSCYLVKYAGQTAGSF